MCAALNSGSFLPQGPQMAISNGPHSLTQHGFSPASVARQTTSAKKAVSKASEAAGPPIVLHAAVAAAYQSVQSVITSPGLTLANARTWRRKI